MRDVSISKEILTYIENNLDKTLLEDHALERV
jgi:hypothetical protein